MSRFRWHPPMSYPSVIHHNVTIPNPSFLPLKVSVEVFRDHEFTSVGALCDFPEWDFVSLCYWDKWAKWWSKANPFAR